MPISKRISGLLIIFSLSIGLSSSLGAVSPQDKKKIAERKEKRKKEKTKGKAKPAASSKKKAATKKSSTVKKVPVKKAPVKQVLPKTPVVKQMPVQTIATYPEVDIATLPAPMTTQVIEPVESIPTGEILPPTDMPSKLSDALINMLPENVKNRIENIIASFTADAQTMFKNIYLLCWVDDELMKVFNRPDFYSTLITVISQECNMSPVDAEAIVADMKDRIDSTLVRFENAITTGDMNNFDIQQVMDLFRGAGSYAEYLDRSVRLAHEYKQSKMVTTLKLALATAGSASESASDEDFEY